MNERLGGKGRACPASVAVAPTIARRLLFRDSIFQSPRRAQYERLRGRANSSFCAQAKEAKSEQETGESGKSTLTHARGAGPSWHGHHISRKEIQ